jgi:hypothetical protein
MQPLMWLRMLNPAERETYQRRARVVAVSYVTMAVCGMIVAVTTARKQGDVVVLHAISKSH